MAKCFNDIFEYCERSLIDIQEALRSYVSFIDRNLDSHTKLFRRKYSIMEGKPIL